MELPMERKSLWEKSPMLLAARVTQRFISLEIDPGDHPEPFLFLLPEKRQAGNQDYLFHSDR